MGRHRLSSSGSRVGHKGLGSASTLKSRSDSTSRSRSRSSSISHIKQPSTISSMLNKIGLSKLVEYLFHINGRSRLRSLYNVLLIELNLPNSSRIDPKDDSFDIDRSYEEVMNMIKIPYYLEQFMIFGLMICFNSFLTLFTLAPLKIIIATFNFIHNGISMYKEKKSIIVKEWLQSFAWVKREIITLSIIGFSLWVLTLPRLDISRLYHEVRGEAHIKLYVIFGVLEVAEKLCSSLGQDIMNILYNIPIDNGQASINYTKFIVFFALAIFYVSFHGYILIYQTVALNVAANSYSNALMALLLSNQFSELKSAVFKKFEREGLFQVSMADLTERFQLSFMLGIIALRNLLQLNSSQSGLIPNSWKSWNTWFGVILGPGIFVIGSEIFVDWLKHCYISKFNKLRPRVYENFLYVFSLDFLEIFNSNSNQHDLTDYIFLTRRIGLPLLASAVCFLRMTLPDLKYVFISPSKSFTSLIGSSIIIVSVFGGLLLLRLIQGVVILKLANLVKQNHSANSLMRRQAKEANEEPFDIKIKVGSTPEPDSIKKEKDVDNECSTPSNSSSPNLKSSSGSPESIIDSSFFPGIPNTEASTINPKTREFLYDSDEEIPPTIEQSRNKKILKNSENQNATDGNEEVKGLDKVLRYEMSSKRIW
ncbi:eukaryotic membrane protein family-domain-containing protein [Scheffersomyces coipomensis]|uniref:eukaryotic membrane protein family-domain-containing protein n=1 Tax=Scheffersomyces coipomensis TaxID=1788519 RepID=UPI00315DB8EB